MVQLMKSPTFFLLILLAFNNPALDSGVNTKFQKDSMRYKRENKMHILLMGASVGRYWNIAALPDRVNNHDYTFEYIHGGSRFDKSKKFQEIISRRENKPDILIIKECAAYFPGDLELYKKLFKGWIKECRENDIIPVPATVVPITRLNPFKQFMIDILKIRNPFRFGNPFKKRRIKEIIEFNDWVRTFSEQNGLHVLDLEAALRHSEKKRYLRGNFARIDGLHLNKKGYKILDQIVIPLIKSVNGD